MISGSKKFQTMMSKKNTLTNVDRYFRFLATLPEFKEATELLPALPVTPKQACKNENA